MKKPEEIMSDINRMLYLYDIYKSENGDNEITLEEFCNNEIEQCNICKEYYLKDDLMETTGMVRGDCGLCCEDCIINADIKNF